MAIPLPVAWAPIEAPPARPVSISGIAQGARWTANYLSGSILGNALSYTDAASFAWYEMSNPDDRIRSSVSETAGEILVGVNATDVSASEAFLLRDLPLGQRVPWADALNIGERLYWFYPSAKLGEEGIDAYRYETKLARLNRTYPPSVLAHAGQIISGRTTVTAREAIDFIFGRWQWDYPWFTWKPVPELFIHNPTGLGFATLNIAGVSLTQDPQNPRSMRSIIDEWLSIFEGHVIRVDADDDLVIVPPHWSAAALPGMAANLTSHDLYELPPPERDTAHIVNRATVESQGYDFVPNQVVMQPAFTRRFWAPTVPTQTAPTDRLAITTIWPAMEGVLIGGEELQVTVAWSLWSTSGGGGLPVYNEGSGSQVVILRRGVRWETTYSVQVCGIFAATSRLTVQLTWHGERVLVSTRANHLYVNNGLGCQRWLGWEVRLNGVGERWMRSAATISATWDEPAAIPGNETSIAQFGVRERTVTSNIFMLTPGQALDVAQGIVALLQHPSRRHRGLEQSSWNAHPVRPRMINRRVALPNGDVGVVEGWDYQDEYGYDAALIRSSFDLVVVDPLAGPALGSLMLAEDGAFMLSEAGALMLVV